LTPHFTAHITPPEPQDQTLWLQVMDSREMLPPPPEAMGNGEVADVR